MERVSFVLLRGNTVILMSIATYVYIDGILLSESSSTIYETIRVTTSTSAHPSPSYIAS